MEEQKVTLTDAMVQKFWDHVKKQEDQNACWLWTGALAARSSGPASPYMYIRSHSSMVRPSRIAWFLEHGEIPPDLLVIHTCGDRLCMNSKHMTLGTKKDLNAKMRELGKFMPRGKHKSCCRCKSPK